MASLWQRFRGLSVWVQAVVAVLVVAVVIAAATGGEDDEEQRAPETVEPDGPGIQAVYDRINSTADCAELQDEFDTAMANAEDRPAGSDQRAVSMSYAEAADERMAALGCYD